MRNVQVTASCWLLAALACACAGTIDDPSQFQASSSSAGATRNRDPREEEEPEARDAGEPEPSASTTLDAGGRASDAGSTSGTLDGGDSAATDRGPSDARASEAATSEPFEAGAMDAAGGSADASSAPDAAAACDFRGLIAAKCGNAGCHGAGAVASGLDLTSDKLATRIAGRKASDACASYLLIDTEQPERSALYLKVTADACGSRMPLGGTLTDKEQLCILQWIENL